MEKQLFTYNVEEFDCKDDIAGTENFTVGADTPFVGAIIGGVIGGVVGAVVGEVIT